MPITSKEPNTRSEVRKSILRSVDRIELRVNILGHANIDVTQNVPYIIRPCAFAQRMPGIHGAEAPKMPVNAAIGRVRISAKSGCRHSRPKRIAGVYVRNLPSRGPPCVPLGGP